MTSINGKELTEGQDTALWVALNHFAVYLDDPANREDLGERLAEGYSGRLAELMRIVAPDAVPGVAVRIEERSDHAPA